MTCPCCGSIIAYIPKPVPMSEHVNLYRYDCRACTATFNYIVEIVRPGLPQNIEKVRDFIFQDRPSSQR